MIEWLKLKTESHNRTPWLYIWCVYLSKTCQSVSDEMWKVMLKMGDREKLPPALW